MKYTVPWFPDLQSTPGAEVPGAVVRLLHQIQELSATMGPVPLSVFTARLRCEVVVTGCSCGYNHHLDLDSAMFYTEIAMELGMVGGLCMRTGADVGQLEQVAHDVN